LTSASYSARHAVLDHPPLEGTAGLYYAHGVEPLPTGQRAPGPVAHGPHELCAAIDVLEHLSQLVEGFQAPARVHVGPAADGLDRELQGRAGGREAVAELVRHYRGKAGEVAERSCGGRARVPRLDRYHAPVHETDAQRRQLEREPLGAAAFLSPGRGCGWPGADGSDQPGALRSGWAADPAASLHDRDLPTPQRAVYIEMCGVVSGSRVAGELGIELSLRGNFPQCHGPAAERDARLP